MPTILTWILAILGALGGILWLRDHAARFFRGISHRRKLKRPPQDFFYNRVEISARISNQGNEWQTIRKATITALSDGLAAVDVGVRPRSATKCDFSIANHDLKLEEREESVSNHTHVAIIPHSPLRKDESLSFDFHCNFSRDGGVPPAEDAFVWANSRRVDELVLRVIFTEVPTQPVRFKISDISDHVLQEGVLQIDHMTHEARFHTHTPRPHLHYAVVWRY